MSENQSLKRALHAMANGSRSGFKTFYNGTAAFIYSSARLLYPSHEEACRFMVDIYQYIYLHLPEYDEKQNIEKWISRMIYERYTQLSIGKEPLAPSVSRQMEAGSVVLSESERTRIWRMLDVQIHFPPEPKKRQSPLPRILFILSVLTLAVLLLIRYVPAILQQNASQTQADDSQAADDADTEDPDADSGDSVQSDEPADIPTDTPATNDAAVSDEQAQMDELEERMNQIHANNSSSESDTATVPDTPDTPDTPNTPDTSVSSTRQNNDSSGTGTSDSLDDLELNLRYGDSLLFGNETD